MSMKISNVPSFLPPSVNGNEAKKTNEKYQSRPRITTTYAKVRALALAAVVIFALASIPRVSAGMSHFRACIAGCNSMPPQFKIVCIPACVVALLIPGG